jgi:DnaJ-class molecular chaperone
MMGKDYYKVLGVEHDVNDKDLKLTYRRLARQYHPDVNPGNKAAEERFKEINQAYEVISDPEKRKKYDQYGDQWQDAEFYDAEREYARPSGSGQTYRRETAETPQESDFTRQTSRTTQGLDVEYSLEITLEEAYSGSVRNISIQSETACAACGGSGRTQNYACTACQGTGSIPKVKHLQVKIPAGVNSGSRIRITGKGKISPLRATAGDLYLAISVQPHHLFNRKDNDISVDVTVPLATAILGGNIQIPTLNGAPITMKIPPETQNEQAFRLVGHGMPILGYSNRGDLMATVKVKLPTGLSAEEKVFFGRFKNR